MRNRLKELSDCVRFCKTFIEKHNLGKEIVDYEDGMCMSDYLHNTLKERKLESPLHSVHTELEHDVLKPLISLMEKLK